MKKNTLRMPVLVTNYRALLENTDYVYLASDSACCQAGRVLLDLSIGSSIRQFPIIMVKPGFDTLCRTLGITSPQNPTRSSAAPPLDPFTRQYLQDLAAQLQDSRIRRVSRNRLHIMLSADSEWNAFGRLVPQQEEPWAANVPEQRALQHAVFRKYRNHTQVVISQDADFLRSLRELCKVGVTGSPNPDGLLTLSLNDQGLLYDPCEAAEDEAHLQARIASRRLAALVRKQPTYMDDSALRHPQAELLLQNIKPALMQEGKALIIPALKNAPLPLADTLLPRAQEEPPTVRFLWLREEIGKTEALIEQLLADTAKLPTDSAITLITDRVLRAEKIQQQLSPSGIRVEIYSINRYGFLSLRNSGRASLPRLGQRAAEAARNKQRIEKAIKAGDIQETLSIAASDPEALTNGIITALCEERTDLLEMLIKNTDRITPRTIDWWITEYRQFRDPGYLVANPRHYELLVQALAKCTNLALRTEKWRELVLDLAESPGAAKTELEFIASLLTLADTRTRGAALPISRLHRSDIPEVLPHSEQNETTRLQARLLELKRKRESLSRELDRLTTELASTVRSIAELEAELAAASAHQ